MNREEQPGMENEGLDIEVFVEQMRALTMAANLSLADEQKQIGYGSYWVRFYNIRERIVIFGYVDSLDDIEAGERSLGARDEEADYVRHDTNRRHNDGYMYGTCYSTLTPDGELGFTHRADIWPISKDLFDTFHNVAWDVDSPDLKWDDKLALASAYAEYATHVNGLIAEVGGDQDR